MSHIDIIKDSDAYFEIDPKTRIIENKTPEKNKIMQYDHNSERFSFSIPRYIEGHDMFSCNKVEIHYINATLDGLKVNRGQYQVTDMQINAEDENKLIFSWLLSQNVSKDAGVVSFVIRFSCVEEDGTIEYAWSTDIFKGVQVSAGIYNTEVIAELYADVLEQWKSELGNINLANYYTKREVNEKLEELAVKEFNESYRGFIIEDEIDGALEAGFYLVDASGITLLNNWYNWYYLFVRHEWDEEDNTCIRQYKFENGTLYQRKINADFKDVNLSIEDWGEWEASGVSGGASSPIVVNNGTNHVIPLHNNTETRCGVISGGNLYFALGEDTADDIYNSYACFTVKDGITNFACMPAEDVWDFVYLSGDDVSEAGMFTPVPGCMYEASFKKVNTYIENGSGKEFAVISVRIGRLGWWPYAE